MDYRQAVDYLTAQGRFGIKLGQERMQLILDRLGHPERGLRGAHIAGTNGKGSTAAMLASILGARGLRCGLMPSPHLASYTERVQVDGIPISEADFASAVQALRFRLAGVSGATEFELLTALALDHLSPRIDRLAAEVGMGGRLDATNVLDLDVAVITNVSLDHQRYLGDTLEAIAFEKAGIIKPGQAVVTACRWPSLEVVEETARAKDCQLWRLGEELQLEATTLGWEGTRLSVRGPGFEHANLTVPLIGTFQAENAALAVAAAQALGDATPTSVRRGLETVRWPGRFEIVSRAPRVVLDGAHNAAAMERLVADLRELVKDERVVVLFGAMADHDPQAMLERLRALQPAAVLLTAVADARAARAEDLARGWGPHGEAVGPPRAALDVALERAGPDGTVLVCGSLYLVGELRPALV